jgi:hypothetical protein
MSSNWAVPAFEVVEHSEGCHCLLPNREPFRYSSLRLRVVARKLSQDVLLQVAGVRLH